MFYRALILPNPLTLSEANTKAVMLTAGALHRVSFLILLADAFWPDSSMLGVVLGLPTAKPLYYMP